MGFRINKGIFQFLPPGETKFINKFKIAEDGEMVEVDAAGTPVAAYMKIGDKATDADKLDGIDSGAFLRSNANDDVTGHTEWQDNYNIRLGNGADFRMYFDGSHTTFRNFNHANGNIYFQGEDIEGSNHALLYMFTATSRPYVSLYENGGERFRTKSNGVEVIGDAFINQGRIHIKRGTGLTHVEWEDDSTANGRAQLILDSHYSDLIIASRNSNSNKHGSTFTLATQSTSTNDVAKWVIGQGQYQEGANIMAFAYGVNHTNPHSVLGTDNANAEMLLTNGSGLWVRNGVRSSQFKVDGTTNSGRIYSDDFGVKVGTTSGHIQFGPANTTWAHIYTDRPNFYFNKNIYVSGARLATETYASNVAGEVDNRLETEIKPLITTAQTTADGAVTTANSALTTAQTAEARANSAREDAAAAQSTADAALPKAGGTITNTITSTKNGTTIQMDGGASAEGIRVKADNASTYPVFLRAVNPSSGETSPWIYKESSTAWGIWHNNPLNSFDFTRSSNNLGIANNVGGQTNSVMIRLNNTDGSGIFKGSVTASYFYGKSSDSDKLDGLDSTAYMRDNGWNSSPGQNADTQPGMSSDFTYSNNAPHTGDLIRFGSSGYSLQLNSTYNNSTGRLSFRARNGDNSTWNIWREIWHTGNFDPASKLGATEKATNSHAADGVNTVGYGNNEFSFNQTPSTFAGYTGWANYFIGNHGSGSSYYNTTHIMPFWGAPQYSRLESGTLRGPYTYWTTENFNPADKENAGTAASVVSELEGALTPQIATAQSTADNAATAASNAQSTADTALSDAGKAATAAAAAQTTADSKLGATAKAADANKLDGYDWMQSGKNVRATEFYADNWFRNYNSGEGIYNQATGQHWYSDGDDYWNIAGGTTFNAIRFRDEHAGTQRGLVGADNSNRIGFLDSGGSWAVRHDNDSGTLFYTDNETLEFRVGRDKVTGNYGTVQTDSTRSGWSGYSIQGNFVFMSSGTGGCGIYNDVDNEWMAYFNRNSGTELHHNGSSKLVTTSAGVTVTGTMTATSFSGDGSGLTGITAPVDFTNQPNNTTSQLASITFDGRGLIFTMADGSAFSLDGARPL